METKSDLGPK
ncbi:unnamed protein product, partial [Rotaria sp. Silwood1]